MSENEDMRTVATHNAAFVLTGVKHHIFDVLQCLIGHVRLVLTREAPRDIHDDQFRTIPIVRIAIAYDAIEAIGSELYA